MKFKPAFKTLLVCIIGILVSFGILHIADKFEPPAPYHYTGGTLYAVLFSVLTRATKNWKDK